MAVIFKNSIDFMPAILHVYVCYLFYITHYDSFLPHIKMMVSTSGIIFIILRNFIFSIMNLLKKSIFLINFLCM